MKFSRAGYNLGVIATILVLIWIGIFKFTPGEAMAIKNYVSHSFLMSWLYSLFSVQMVSNLIGIFEIITGLFLIASFWNHRLGLIGGYLSLVIFLTTLSFVFTTPGIWKMSEGVPVTDFFVIKDLAFLSIALLVVARHREEKISDKGSSGFPVEREAPIVGQN
jgi:reactive chlorine resistance protein C